MGHFLNRPYLFNKYSMVQVLDQRHHLVSGSRTCQGIVTGNSNLENQNEIKLKDKRQEINCNLGSK